jgi:hypothetical protein
MAITVFYSWQADLPNSTNRGFIERALNAAVTSLRTETDIREEIALERDTAGVSGAPDIADTIFDKILNADIFVGDVSIVTRAAGQRSTPNPNVLIELGYAASHLGWSSIICVFNQAYGELGELPFDLRNRRILAYRCPEDLADKTPVRNRLAGTLQGAIKEIVDNPNFIRSPLRPYLFFGNPDCQKTFFEAPEPPIDVNRVIFELERETERQKQEIIMRDRVQAPMGKAQEKLSELFELEKKQADERAKAERQRPVEAYVFRIRVRNEGHQGAEGVEVFASELLQKRNDGLFEKIDRFLPMNLLWTHTGERSCNLIAPDSERNCDLGFIFEPRRRFAQDNILLGVSANQTVLNLMVERQPPTLNDVLVPGIYNLVLQVSSTNFKPASCTLEIELSGNWYPAEPEMLGRGINIRML